MWNYCSLSSVAFSIRTIPGFKAFWLAILAVCVGCSETTTSRTQSDDLGRGSTAEDIHNAGHYELAQTRHQISLETQEYIQSCMKQQGWDYHPVDETEEFEYASNFINLVVEGRPDESGVPSLSVAESLRQAVTEDAIFSDPETSSNSQANRDYSRGLTTEEQVAYADDLDSCYAEAEESLGVVEFYRNHSLVEQIRHDSWERVHANASIQRLLFDWEQCMNDSGLDQIPPHPVTVREWLVQSSVESLSAIDDSSYSEIEASLKTIMDYEMTLNTALEYCNTEAFIVNFDDRLQSEIEHRLSAPHSHIDDDGHGHSHSGESHSHD